MSKKKTSNEALTLPETDEAGVPVGGPKSWADIKKAKTRRQFTHTMVLDHGLLHDLVKAQQAVGDEDDDGYAEAKAEVDRVLESVEAATVQFHFQSISRNDLWAMLKEHPPTKAQQAAHRKRLAAGEIGMDEMLRYDPDTFPPVLIAACLTEPEMTEAEVQEMWEDDDFSEGELGGLFNTVWSLNQSGS